jgi:FkbM family methyltransferase
VTRSIDYRMMARKLVRSALVRTPRLYDRWTGQWRYRTYYRLGIVHEREFRALPLLVRELSSLVLDIGGNNGQSILSIKQVLPQARVITFEPASRHQADLQALAARFDGVTIRRQALGKSDREETLYWPIYNGMAMHALASLDRGEAESWLDPSRIYGFRQDQLELAHERVEVRRLDGLGLEPDMIKIDVQGTEADVIVGGIETIERRRPIIMAESLHEGGQAHALVEPHGYGVYTFRDGRFTQGADAGATNHFLIPTERLPE